MGYDNPLRFSAYGRRFEYPPFKSPVDYIEQCQDQRQTNERFLSGLRYILNRVSEWCYEIVSGVLIMVGVGFYPFYPKAPCGLVRSPSVLLLVAWILELESHDG